MTVGLHPSIDSGVKKGSGSFAGGTLVCKCADKQVKVGIKGDVAPNHACTQYIFRWILLKRPHASSI